MMDQIGTSVRDTDVNGGPKGLDDLEQASEVFASVRPQLFGIAYRMLSSVAEAEDLVQEVWLRWQKYDRSTVTNPTAFLATTTTRLAITELGSARARRETYVGEWLPEPVDTSADPYLGAERNAALEFAVMLLMEKLTPNERAAYVLREAFDYPYAQIAEILQSTEPAVRQLVSRARKHVVGARRAPVSAAAQRKLLTAFVAAARSGDMTALEQLFAPDVASVSDGNGKKGVARQPVVGVSRVLTLLKPVSAWFGDGVEVEWVTMNGQACALLRTDGAVSGLVTISASAEGIDELLWQLNPEKLSIGTRR